MSLTDSRFKLAMFDKLSKQKESSEIKVKELTFEIELLKESGESEFDYIEKLMNRREGHKEKLRNSIAALDQLEKDLNGGTSLNPFLEKEKVESETEE